MEVNEDENLAAEALGQLGCCQTWTCQICDILFFTEIEYNDHVKIHGDNEDVKYECNRCPENFKIKIELENHMDTHLTSETFKHQCSTCLMWFQRLSSLKNHEKVHLPNTIKSLMNFNKPIKTKRFGMHKRKRVKKEPPSPAFELISKSAYSSNEDSDSDTEKNVLSFQNDNYQFLEIEQCDNGLDVATENVTTTELDDNKFLLNELINNSVPPVDSTSNMDVSKPHTCIFCEKKFAREKAFLSHMKLHDDNFEISFLTCAKCETTFDDLASLQSHVNTCIVKKEPMNVDSDGSDDYFNPFVDKSPKKFLNIQQPRKIKSEFSFHDDRSTLFRVSSGKFACTSCTKSFKTRQKLFRHAWIHRNKEYNCEVCHTSFYTSVKLEDHMETFHSPDKPFVCEECGKGYSSQRSLNDHKAYHLNRSRQLCCPYCKKQFSSRQGFTIHQRIHTGERPYICEYCTKPFRDGATLRKHELIHTGERPFKCPICEAAFNQKVVLREHIRGVHVFKVKARICELCNEEKPDSESLSEHLVKHSDEMRGPATYKRRNPFIIKWTEEHLESSKMKSSALLNKKKNMKKGRPKGSSSDQSNKKVFTIHKNNIRNSKKLSKIRKPITPPIRKSKREKKFSQVFSNYIQEDLDLLLELSKEEDFKTKKSKVSAKKSIKKIKNSRGKRQLKNTSGKMKRKRKPRTKTLDSSEDDNSSNDGTLIDSKIQVKSTIIVGREIEHNPSLNFMETCAMCNEKFSSREDLLTHVTIHI